MSFEKKKTKNKPKTPNGNIRAVRVSEFTNSSLLSKAMSHALFCQRDF